MKLSFVLNEKGLKVSRPIVISLMKWEVSQALTSL
jgi:hypothetical protein